MGDEQNFARDIRKGLKDTWLRFAENYLRSSGDEFLEGFGVYLEEGYKDAEQNDFAFRKPSGSAEQFATLKMTLDFDFIGGYRVSRQDKGYALLGKTGFSKLTFIKNYLEARGLAEIVDRKKGGHFVTVDCSRLRGYASFVRVLEKNRDVPYVIFDNCESLLKHDYALQAIKILAEASEHSFYSGLSFFPKNGGISNFKTDSHYIFLGEENTLHTAVEKEIKKDGSGYSAWNHLDAFVLFIQVYDFEKQERYHGREFEVHYDGRGGKVAYLPEGRAGEDAAADLYDVLNPALAEKIQKLLDEDGLA